MKKTLLAVLLFVTPFFLKAQSFDLVSTNDSVFATIITVGHANSGVINLTGGNIYTKWHVINSDFPASWLTPAAFGLCDNSTCRFNNFNLLWNSSTTSGNTFSCTDTYNTSRNDTGILYLDMDLTNAVTGTHWMTVSVTDTVSNLTKTVTFVINRGSFERK